MLLEFLEVEAGQDEPLKEVYAFRKLWCAATWVNSRLFVEVNSMAGSELCQNPICLSRGA